MTRRQIEVDVPHQAWNPGQSTVRMAMGVGLWDAANHRYLLPQVTADATQPGGAGTATNPAAFLNVGFRTAEPAPSVMAQTGAVTNPAWWHDAQQDAALANGDISPFFSDVNFAKLAAGVTDNAQIPVTGANRSDSRQSLRAGSGRQLFGRVRSARRQGSLGVRAGVSGQPPALRDLHPGRRATEERLRDDAAVALTVLQLQPVFRQSQSVTAR